MKPEPIGIVAAIRDQERKEERKASKDFSFIDAMQPGIIANLGPDEVYVGSEGSGQILSADHVCKLLKLGLDDNLSGSTEGRAPSRSVDVATRGAAPVGTRPESDQGSRSENQASPAQNLTEGGDAPSETHLTQSSVPASRAAPRSDPEGAANQPKFTVPTWPIDPLSPFKGTDSDGPEFTQMDVARVVDGELVTVECIAEVEGYNTEEPELGACFDLYGNEIILTPEERERNLDEWKAWMEENARG